MPLHTVSALVENTAQSLDNRDFITAFQAGYVSSILITRSTSSRTALHFVAALPGGDIHSAPSLLLCRSREALLRVKTGGGEDEEVAII